MPRPRPARLLCLFLLAASATGALALLPSAQAEVVRQNGFWADVAGYHGWFGSYAMGDVGTAWCVDHGLGAPDPDLGYRPAELTDHPPPIRRATAWALGAHGQQPDRITAAALTLVLHDLTHQAYPAGPLRIEDLAPGDLRGFEGSELQVLERARAIRADALAHADVEGPLRLTVQVEPVKAGLPGVLAARVIQPSGAGVAGVALEASLNGRTLPPVPESRTGASGEQRFSFLAAPGANRFEVRGVVPDLSLQTFAPTAARAQRVARPGQVPLSAAAVMQAESPRLTVHKVGEVPAYLGSGGARFEVRSLAGGGPASEMAAELVTGVDGRTPSAELAPGRYQVVEAVPPAGYETAGPWTVNLATEDVTLHVADRARRGAAQISKVDADSGRPVTGATLSLAYDADRDGSFETAAGTVSTGQEPVTRSQLLPGDYQLSELAAPPGYQPAARAVPFTVAPGRTTPVTLTNRLMVSRSLPVTLGSAPPRSAARTSGPGELPATGQPLGQLSLVALGLLMGGGSMTTAAGGLSRRAQRRARRRARALARPGLITRPTHVAVD